MQGRPGSASTYAFGIAKALAFVAGYKRLALVTALTFLRLNGYAFRLGPVKGITMMKDHARGPTSQALLLGRNQAYRRSETPVFRKAPSRISKASSALEITIESSLSAGAFAPPPPSDLSL